VEVSLAIAPRSVCDEVRALASLALDEALTDELGAHLVTRHVAECAACARFAADVGVVTRLLRNAPLEPHRCGPVRLALRSRARAHRAHGATMAAAVLAVTIGVASLPQATSPPPPLIPPGAFGATAPVKLPIGQKSAESDFVEPRLRA
jgi:hypothetical protein